MENGVIKLSLLSRSLGPSCSNVELLFLGEKCRLYRAYGVPGGAILVQRLPVTQKDLAKSTVTTEIVIDGVQSASTNRIDDICLLSYSHSETCLLAAVSSDDLTIHSLLPFHTASSSEATKQSPSFERLLSVPFPGVLSLGWTGDGEGLLLSDARCQITCLIVSTQSVASPAHGLARRSVRSELMGSIEIRWVIKLKVPHELLSPGHLVESCFAIGTSSTNQSIRIVTPSLPQHTIQALPSAARVTSFVWSPVGRGNAASMKPCLLTVEINGVIRVWVESSNGTSSHLGAGQLTSSTDQNDKAYHVEVVMEPPDPALVSGSMHAAWVDPFWNGGEDPRLAWIVATYLLAGEKENQEFCSVYAVHGLPVELEGTRISCSCVASCLHSSVQLGDRQLSSNSLFAALLRQDPTPRILLVSSATDRHLAETRSSLLCVEHATQAEPLSVRLESSSVNEIVGFASAVRQLVMHPKYDFVCVLTEDRVVSLWDLWPVRKLCQLHGADCQVGSGIHSLAWMDLGHHDGGLGHILVLGEKGAAICLLSAHQVHGKPVVSVQPVQVCLYNRVVYPLSVTLLSSTPDSAFHELTYLVRSRSVDAELDDEEEADSYMQLSVRQRHTHDIEITQNDGDCLFGGDEAVRYTAFCQIHQDDGSVVAGTREGTLEFFRCGGPDRLTLEHCSSCPLSTGSQHPSFISCMSTCTHAPYIACVTSFDTHQNEDKIHILQSESTCGRLDYRLEDSFVSPAGIVSRISWVQTPSPFLSLVVGYQAGQVDVFVRKRHGLWVPVGKYFSSLKLTTLTTTRQGLPVVGSGRHMLFLSNDSRPCSVDAQGDSSLMQAALSVGGPFPDYHHIPLLVLLQLGHLQSIGLALRRMTEFLKDWEQTPEEERLEEIYAPTINGPAAPLEDVFSERIAPDLIGIMFGDNVLKREPFVLNEQTVEAIQETERETSDRVQDTSVQNSGLLAGQFDMSQFSNNFNEEPKATPAFEETGLLDMSAFGMGFAALSSGTEDDTPAETQSTVDNPQHEQHHLEAATQERNVERDAAKDKEDCVMFSTDTEFDAKCRELLSLERSMELSFDHEYMQRALKDFIQCTESGEALPLDCLLKLSKTSAAMLSDILSQYLKGMRDLPKTDLDVPGMKFLLAATLIPLSTKSQPKKAESKNNLPDFRREDYVSPFLKVTTTQSLISEASVASDDTDSSVMEDRLTEGYVSWPESVGIASGIEAIHVLWALESKNQYELLTACLEATKTETRPSARESASGYSWERLKQLGCGFWIRDKETALRVADEIAKEQFKRNNDPHDCALMYIALKKQSLLSRLFRSNGHPRVADLLSKDFSQEQNQQIAAKNAFVLLGQHRYSLAAALFLVGGHFKDAVGVCAKEMLDPQLALFLANLLDDNVHIKNDIITKEIFPHAVAADDRVAQGMLLWIMEDHVEALKAITTVKALKSELSVTDRAVSKILLLQFVLWRGLIQLSGRYVPLWMLQQIKNVAAHCAHVLETCGMPSLALRAMQSCQELERRFPNPQENPLYSAWNTRLAIATMMTHLPSPQAVHARDPAMILWHQHVQKDVQVLNECGVKVDGEAVFQQMQYVMDCLYDVPCAPLFPKQGSHPPDLGCTYSKTSVSSPLPTRLSFDGATTRRTEEQHGSRIVVSNPCDLLHVDGDRCVGVCLSKEEGFYGVRSMSTKKIAVATGKHGIHFIDWDSVERPSASNTYSAIYSEFEKRRWPSLSWLRESSVLDKQGQPISMREVLGGPLKSHPSSAFFLSGCSEDGILLWQYGESVPCAKFPMVSKTGIGADSVHRISWSETGDRVAAVGTAGICGVWDVASAHTSTSIGTAYWSRQIASKKGYDVEFINGNGSVIATSGEDELGRGVFSLWDTLAPQSSCRVAHLEYRHSVTELATIPGTLIFLSAQDSGSIQAHDFRMLGEAEPKPLWSLNSMHDGAITSMEVGWAPSTSSTSWELSVATGGRDGDICLVNGIAKAGDLRQRLQKAHWKKSGQLAHFILSGLKGNLGNISVAPFDVQRIKPESASGVPVMDLDWCDEGLLTAGADGIVQLFPFATQSTP